MAREKKNGATIHLTSPDRKYSPPSSPFPDEHGSESGMASPLPRTTSSPMPMLASAVPSFPRPMITEGWSMVSSGALPSRRSW